MEDGRSMSEGCQWMMLGRARQLGVRSPSRVTLEVRWGRVGDGRVNCMVALGIQIMMEEGF